MINRYSSPNIRSLWSLEHKFNIWQKIEVLTCEYWYKAGKIPPSDWLDIKKKVAFSVNRILEIEKTLHHDVIAFTTNLAENIGPASRFIHFGLTSSDVVDTAFSFIIQETKELILKQFQEYLDVLKAQAIRYKNQIIVGRTHGVHAEPTTLGLKLVGFYEEGKRNYKRLKLAFDECAYGKISGAVGTYSQVSTELEEFVLGKLKLKIEPMSTQVIPRDRHAFLLNMIALTGQGLARLAQEIRLLQKTESREVEESFQKGQKGSSAMPHKKNPILCERICGLARVLSGYAASSYENILLWHERDISHSSAERIIFPDATSLIEYLLTKITSVIKNLSVSSKRCEHVFNETNGLLFSSRVLLLITEKLKITREEAYAIVQDLAMKVWSHPENYNLRSLLESHSSLGEISSNEWDQVFNTNSFLKNIDYIYERCL